MIIYQATKSSFILDVLEGSIDTRVGEMYVRETGARFNKSQYDALNVSLRFMKDVVDTTELPDDCGIAIEYKIPQSAKRIDFMITGISDNNRQSAVIVELKQWSGGVSVSSKDAIVDTTFFGETNHPSYQAWSYAALLSDYNSSIQDNDISLRPCAYLHNYSRNDGVVNDDFYKEWTDKAPVFFKEDAIKLREFSSRIVKYGDGGKLLYEIDNGKIKPSKSLADSLHSMLEGNAEFILIDKQKLVYETAIEQALSANSYDKKVMIVKGGPGTGKSVVAINLLTELTRQGQVTQYVTRNSAPREVYQYMLTGKFTKSRISNLFTSSGTFYDIDSNMFDALIIDEAQRLNERSGMFKNKGANQIDELIKSSKFCIFFIDEDQRVHIDDIGEIDLIINKAEENEAICSIYELESQFRCNGSDGYLAWLDDVLQVRDTANENIADADYNISVVDNPELMHSFIREINMLNNKSRMLAGYCWDWVSKKNPYLTDIKIGNYVATWNLAEHGQAWLVQPESVSEVGCIHTCQGLELDYVGVIIGPDLIVRDGKVITDALQRAKTDKSIFGYKKMYKENPERALQTADYIIKNTYRVLMSRGTKGCYLYSTDKETQDYFRQRVELLNEKRSS